MTDAAADIERRDRDLFNRISDSYARKDLAPSSRAARRLRLDQTLRYADLPDRPDVLEIGCGAGYSAAYLDGRIGAYHGVDYAGDLIAFARRTNGREGVTFHEMNAKDLPADLSFDVIFMIGVLHHIDDTAEAMRGLHRNLKPGGWFIANEPQRGNPFLRGLRWVRKKTDRNYSEDQIEYTGAELRALYEAAGFENIGIYPQGVFSTPFAEVVMPLQLVTAPLSRGLCAVDRFLERTLPGPLKYLSWNLIAQGQKPPA